MRTSFIVLLLTGAALAAPARAQIYRCEGPNGVIEYSNAVASGSDRNCRTVDLPTVTTIPAPKLPPNAARPPSPSGAPGTANASPGGFPRVDASTQKARDSDRKRILEDELRKEEKKLAELQAEYNNGEPERRGDERNYQKYLDRVQRLKDEIGRSQGNVESLRRELGSLQ